MPDEEIWKPVKGFEGRYEVSSLGRVRTVERRAKVVKNGKEYTRAVHAKILKTRMNCGAVVVSLNSNENGYVKTVASLVAETFIGPPPYKNANVKHIDGDPLNNSAANIEWHARKAFYLPENPEARKLFYECAEKNVLKFIHVYHHYLNMGIVDTDDFMQEALLKIWLNIDAYDGKVKFSTFCYTKCDNIFKTLCRKFGRIKSWEISAYETCDGDDTNPLYLIDVLASTDNFYERIETYA